MAIRSVATTDTLETFRTTFNSLGTDVGDLTSLSGVTAASSIVVPTQMIRLVNNMRIYNF